MARGMLISFVGIDGSGKTTLANHVLASSRGRNMRPFSYLWFRSPFQLALSARLERRREAMGEAKLGAGKPWRPQPETLLSRVYQWLVWLDYVLVLSMSVRWRLFRGENLICDRYAHDIAVDLAADFGQDKRRLRRRLRWVQRVFPKPDATFFVDVPEEVSLARKDDVPNREFLTARRRGYQLMTELPGVNKLDGTRTRDAVFQETAALLADIGVKIIEPIEAGA